MNLGMWVTSHVLRSKGFAAKTAGFCPNKAAAVLEALLRETGWLLIARCGCFLFSYAENSFPVFNWNAVARNPSPSQGLSKLSYPKCRIRYSIEKPRDRQIWQENTINRQLTKALSCTDVICEGKYEGFCACRVFEAKRTRRRDSVSHFWQQ